nr:translocon-associated protein subunit delta-like [Leptinotarsa decemlineata]
MPHFYLLITYLISFFAGLCSSCSNPEVTSTSFTTLDATIVSNIAYISEFTVKCSSGVVGNLYSELDGNISPVSIVGSNQYQVSWTEEPKTARKGERLLRLFNEDGYTAYRKAIRAKEDVSAVPALFTVVVNHPGAFNGPWLKSEFIATILSLVIAYFALVSRSKVVS